MPPRNRQASRAPRPPESARQTSAVAKGVATVLVFLAIAALAVWYTRKASPDPSLQHAALGRSLYTQGKFEESVKELREAVRLMGTRKDPRHADTLVFLGNALAEHGQTNDAASCFREALEVQPKNPDAHAALAALMARSGDVKQATEHNREALTENPSNVTAHVNLAVALAGEGKFEEAVPHYQAALKLDPNLPSTRIGLAIALSVLGRVEEAQAEYNKAAATLKAHAAGLVQQGRTNEAIASYQEAVRLVPNNADAHCALGILYQQQGRVADARAQYFEALRIKPGHPEATTRLRELPLR